MISVDEARARLLALVEPSPVEAVPLHRAAGRVLARDLLAPAPQPPFAASSMDGYALAGPAGIGTTLPVVGEAAAGRPFAGALCDGQAVRILTGGALPEGADRIVIQEDVDRDGDAIVLRAAPAAGAHVRAAGSDFPAGHVITAPCVLTPARVALAAAMGHGVVEVRRRPDVAIAMTGDELVWPGEAIPDGSITASNGFGLAAMIQGAGAAARILPIARDDARSLRACLDLAADADLVVTIGGASVGDHDLVASVATGAGLALAFHTVRMRPGKPLLAGRLGRAAYVGLPGNPVSALVCGTVFVLPMVRTMLGLPPGPAMRSAPLAAAIDGNGPREHYMRARTEADGTVRVFERQDSSLLSVLSEADVLVRRPPGDPGRGAGEVVDVVAV